MILYDGLDEDERHDELEYLRARIAELEAQNVELQKDRERLDWLEQFVKKESMVDVAAFMDEYDHSLWEITITRANDCWPGNDIRQAIDNARE